VSLHVFQQWQIGLSVQLHDVAVDYRINAFCGLWLFVIVVHRPNLPKTLAARHKVYSEWHVARVNLVVAAS